MAARIPGLGMALLALAGCTTTTGALDDFPGARPQILAFYEARARERNGTCSLPFIHNIASVEEVSDDGRLVVLQVGYAWDIRLRNSRFGSNCQGIGSRLFTLERSGDAFRVVEMSGDQRAGPR